MGLLLSLPAVLSLLTLGAHVLHLGGSWVWVGMCAGLCGLLISRRWWTLYIVQTVLVLAAIDWVFTAFNLMQERQAAGQPWMRAAAILLGVAVLNVAAAVLLRWRNTDQTPVPGIAQVPGVGSG